MALIVFTLGDGSTITTPLDVDLITVGRASDSIVQLPDPSVSSHHATVKSRSDGYYVQDLGSRNGTRVNGVVIEESKLKDGDKVAFGDIESVFYATNDVPAAPPRKAPTPAPVPNVVEPLVVAAAPVTGLPHGRQAPPPRRVTRRRSYGGEGGGCGSAFLVLLLFGGAFIIGLCLRHYKETDGGVLPNDFIAKFFNKVHLTIDEPAKK